MRLNEEKIAEIISEEIKNSEVLDKLKKDKNFNKYIKDICSEVITDLFRVLWQHNSLFKQLSK